MKNELENKYEKLKQYLTSLGSVAVAFSGGVDSTFLLEVASNCFKSNNIIAITARSYGFPERELNEAKEFAAQKNIRHVIIDINELEIEGFANNPVNRCYLCKTVIFTKIKEIAAKNGIYNVIEGSNADDSGDYRPGMQAIAELEVKSPLRFANLTKNEIRQLSKNIGLPTWEKQSFACLATRFPYGETITAEKLSMIDKAEQYLIDFGFQQVRVRNHGNLARIEVGENEIYNLLDKKLRKSVYEYFKQIGFTYISVDLLGYRTGSMNETI